MSSIFTPKVAPPPTSTALVEPPKPRRHADADGDGPQHRGGGPEDPPRRSCQTRTPVDHPDRQDQRDHRFLRDRASGPRCWDSRAKFAVKIGDALFSQKQIVDNLHQEIAENFYPERADFTTERTIGDEFAEHLYTSYPVIARRELGNMMSSSLRRADTQWVSIHAKQKEVDKERDARAFLEFLSDVHFNILYQRGSNFVRATKEGDHDYAAFGNAVPQISPNLRGDGLLFRDHHLRDCAWSENSESKIDAMHRNWKPTARQLERLFPKTISNDVKRALTKDPEHVFKCRHIVLPSRLYKKTGKFGREFPFVSLYIECETETVLEEVGQNYFGYPVARWQTVSGSQYATSMATSVMLPDGRTMQAIVRTLREAGEKFVDPPMIAFGDAIRGDMALYAGGVTIADVEYNEKSGEVLRPLNQDRSGIPIGFDLADALKADIASGFFLDKMSLPEVSVEMTAFEVRRRIQEQLRSSTPIFEPINEGYSEPLNEEAFNVANSMGLYPLDDMPDSLDGEELSWKFRSPLAELAEQEEAEIFLDTMTRFAIPMRDLDPAQLERLDIESGFKDAIMANGWKAKWTRSDDEFAQRTEQMRQQAAQQQEMETAAVAAEIAQTGGQAAKTLSEAGG